MKKKGEPFDAAGQAATFKDKIQNSADQETLEELIETLSTWRWAARLEVCRLYQALTQSELQDDLLSVCDTSIHSLIKELLTDRVQADVTELVVYFQKADFYHRELVEFFCLRTNIALAVVSAEYTKQQDISIVEELEDVQDAGVKAFLLGICKGEFSEGSYAPNEMNIRKDAMLLAKAPKTQRWISRDGKLHHLLQTRCHAHVRDVIYDFEEVTGENFLDVVEAECSVEFLRCMEAFDYAISSTPNVFAKKMMHFLLDGNVDSLVKVFANAVETNIGDIVEYYEEKYDRRFLSDLQTIVEPPLFNVMKRIIGAKQRSQPKAKSAVGNGQVPAKSNGTASASGSGHGSGHNGGLPAPVDTKFKFFTHGTVSPLKSFDPYRDVHDMRIAMQHYPSNDLPLIYLICSKTNHQRQVLKSVYREVFDSDMIEEIMETVGEELDFFMAALLMKSEEFDATFLHELIENGNETSFALLEILCSKTVKELHGIGQQYSKKYNVSVSSDMEKHFTASMPVRLLLCELSEGKREVGWTVDKMMAETDAREMYQQFYRDSPQIDFFVQILTGRSREQLRETFRTFRRFAGIDVLTALEPLFSAEFAEAMRLLGTVQKHLPSFPSLALRSPP
ncbi:hypothetical protein RvY_12421-2 [Ramazzottius varieornatus]|uniref:Annexin n=1 Tax=Ramazzottius varieornatus TaxID=947166 RepID=A0A1D1VNN2_RAMVA|nr:hypothetical protein RvY_12421-2 [Ramazzottius varieornatus]